MIQCKQCDELFQSHREFEMHECPRTPDPRHGESWEDYKQRCAEQWFIANTLKSRKNGEFDGACDYEIITADGECIGMVYKSVRYAPHMPTQFVWRVIITTPIAGTDIPQDKAKTIDSFEAPTFKECKKWAQNYNTNKNN